MKCPKCNKGEMKISPLGDSFPAFRKILSCDNCLHNEYIEEEKEQLEKELGVKDE